MIPKPHPPLESSDRIAAPSQPDLQDWIDRMVPDGKLLRCWPLQGGISAAMTAFEVEWPGGETHTLVLRQVPDAQDAEREFRTLMALQRLRLPAPFPILLDPPFLITRYSEGAVDFSLTSADRIAAQMATSLAKIHTADMGRVDTHFLPKIDTRLASELQNVDKHPNDLMSETCLRRVLTSALPIKQRNPSVLLHGDYWPGNLLWHNGSLAAVIDWEDAALGDPLADMAVARLDLHWIFNAVVTHTFTTKYLSQNKIDITELPLWDLYAALRFVRLAGDDLPGWAAYFSAYGRPDITAETILRNYTDFVAHALRHVQSMQTNSI